MDNSKYVVFKVGDWLDQRQHLNDLTGGKPSTVTATIDEALQVLDRARIEDAVVIRQQDIFAASALHTYASSISVALTVLRGTRPSLRGDENAIATIDKEIARLQELADFFDTMAAEAEAKGFKVPD